jgi:hypothetical protein
MWGALDLLMFDLPPGAERTVQYAEFLGPGTSFLLVTIPQKWREASCRDRSLLCRRTQPSPRLRREYERLLLPRLQRGQAALRLIRIRPSLGNSLPRNRAVRPGTGAALRSRNPFHGTARNSCRPSPGSNRAETSGTAYEIPLCPLRYPDEAANGGTARPRLVVDRSTRVPSAATRWRCSPTRMRHKPFSLSACESVPRATE